MSCCENKKRKETTCCDSKSKEQESCCQGGNKQSETHESTERSTKHHQVSDHRADDTKPLKSLDEWDDWKRDYELKQIALAKEHAHEADQPASNGENDDNNGNSNGHSLKSSKSGDLVGVIATDKPKAQFRNYIDGARQQRVEKFYKQQHTLQDFEFVKMMEEKYNPLQRFQMGVWEALEYLDKIVDESDPDIDLTQLQHALQTAEACRAKWPDEKFDWIHLTGLIHDLGKILAVKDSQLGLPGEPQWAVVGDTFPVGVPFSEKNVMHDFFKENADTNNPKYSKGLGIYEKGCGLTKVHMSYGHDEYIYQVMVGNNIQLPTPALYMLRYHSFYPWHREGAYTELMDDQDREMLKFVKEFNECDLYSKSEAGAPSVKELAPYYKKLIDKYMPGQLRW